MKIIVTHTSPDWDAIASVWLIKRFLPNWENAKVMYVPAGERIKNSKMKIPNNNEDDAIEKIGEDEVIHVDTGMGPLDHHQISDLQVCGASRTWDFVKKRHEAGDKWFAKADAIERIVDVVVIEDHFQTVYWPDAAADYHDFSLIGLLQGLKYQKPGEDDFYILFGMECLDAILYTYENKGWAEKEIKEKGIPFETRFGKAIGVETMNDTVIKLAQKMGYVIVIRKDPKSGFVRIKTVPQRADGKNTKENEVDFSLVAEKLRKMDPQATWFLHVSKKMLLNGTTKNPKMIPTTLSLEQIINVIKEV